MRLKFEIDCHAEHQDWSFGVFYEIREPNVNIRIKLFDDSKSKNQGKNKR